MDELAIRTANLWDSFARKHPPLAHSTHLEARPEVDFEQIGGLAEPKEEILTLACATTNPEVYARWGTQPATGTLLIGRRGVGKGLLARALATRAETSFLQVRVPRLVIEVVHSGGKVGEILGAWSEALAEFPPFTLFFDELEFSQTQEIGARRPDLPVGPIMDFLLDLVDRSVRIDAAVVVGSTAHPDTLRPAFLAPGRFERVIEVNPVFPDDFVEALQIHRRAAEKRAGRPLFAEVDWAAVVSRYREPSIGDWVRLLHAVLRHKARLEAAGEAVRPVSTEDVMREAERFRKTIHRLAPGTGTYL